jgi:hypothetical protein
MLPFAQGGKLSFTFRCMCLATDKEGERNGIGHRTEKKERFLSAKK